MEFEFNGGIERYPDSNAYNGDLVSLWSQKVAEKQQQESIVKRLTCPLSPHTRKLKVVFA